MRHKMGFVSDKRKVSALFVGRPAAMFFCVVCVMLCGSGARAAELRNDSIRLALGVTDDGVPRISDASWLATGNTIFTAAETIGGFGDWLPDSLTSTSGVTQKPVRWYVSERSRFFRAVASRDFAGGLTVTWVVELAKTGTLFRVHVRMRNSGIQTLPVKWFPAWTAKWAVTDGAKWARWWQPLEFQPVEADLASIGQIKLGSRLHSSDVVEGGVNPYWIVGTKDARLYFGLEWCGGWDTKLEGTPDGKGLSFSIRLPAEETQLELEPGETVEGPAVHITPTNELDDYGNRSVWMAQRRAIAQTLYGGPLPSFPLTYNTWYATRFDVDAGFLNRQLEAMAPYAFDAFIVDAGWYDRVGNWVPDLDKFEPDEFEGILRSIKDRGVKAGVWSCPQFVSAPSSGVADKLENPIYFEDFIKGYLLDLTDSDFTTRLTDHVALLRDRYSADWWKYDQTLFTEQSRAGAMKNVLAFQQALKTVRLANPDLTIENCQSGGRMINELTLLATQTSWLEDGGATGIDHARANIGVALGALEFIFPWSVYRWTNNFDEMDEANDEQTRFYCRSAMAGIWGISSDLSAITNGQRAVILKEIENYRLLNEIKKDCRYELQPPTAGRDTASVAFYGEEQNAAMLLYRWDGVGAFQQKVKLGQVSEDLSYQVTDIDTGIQKRIKGKKLIKKGVSVAFDGNRLSALLFIEPVK